MRVKSPYQSFRSWKIYYIYTTFSPSLNQSLTNCKYAWGLICEIIWGYYLEESAANFVVVVMC